MLEIKDWKNVFYLAEAWKHAEVWWTKFPVARASVSYRRLMATREGHTAFCVFIGLLRMVQRGKTQGVLAVKGKPITAIDVAAETGISVKLCQAGMKMLESEEIGWLVPHVPGQAKTSVDGQTNGQRTAEDRPATGGAPADERRTNGVTPSKRREEKRREDNSSSSKSPVAVREPVRHGGGIAAAAAGSAKGREEGGEEPAADRTFESAFEANLIAKRAAAIARRPEWLPEKFGWIEGETARRLAALPFTTRQWHEVIREARRSRNTLENPAGFVIRRLEAAGVVGGAA